MALDKQIISTAEFDDFIQDPAHGDLVFEFINGEIVEVPSNPYSSKISLRFGRHIGAFVDDNNLGHVTGEAGLYMVGRERYAPDVAYISKARQPELAHSGPNPNPPDLAVEVLSDEDSAREIDQLLTKISHYLAAGTIVWVVYPRSRQVKVHVPGQPVQVFGIDDNLSSDLLPGFKLPLAQLFRD
jgi:Uma2 family endonuclease